jgi:VWFA-related protein
MIKACTFAAWVLVCCATAATAQSIPPEQPPFRTGIELVNIDATVLDRQGRPLRGLAADDFVVSVAGQPRRVVSAEFVDWTASPQGPPDPNAVPLSTNEGARGGRSFVFVVDQNTLEPGTIRQIAAAASGLFGRLTPEDRSALVVIPVGEQIELTWAHDRVYDALGRVGGVVHAESGWEHGSLAEARDIATQNTFALRQVAERECGGSMSASGGGFGAPTGGGGQGGGTGTAGGGAGGGGGGGTGGTGGGGGSPSDGGGSGGGGASPGFAGGMAAAAGGGGNQCVRTLQMQADMAWRSVEATSMTSVTALRQVLGALARVGGDKTVVFISGGMPLDERDQISILSTVAADSAAARAMVFTFFVPASASSASRRTMTTSPGADERVLGWPLETLAGMTGGASYRADVGAQSAFERLTGELTGYYRIAVGITPGDLDGKARPLKVRVPRGNTTVRARATFDTRTYEDRDRTARLNAAVTAPSPATGVGLRLTSYVAANREDPSLVKLVLAGEASRLADGDATFQVVVRDQTGRQITSPEQLLGTAVRDRLPFSINVPVSPGSYSVRFAVMDSAGHVGSVDHRADAYKVPLGPLFGFGPLLVRLPDGSAGDPSVALDGVHQNDRLALQVDLTGEPGPLDGTEVVFEIASAADGPALVQSVASMSTDPERGTGVAEGVADVRLLPPGRYVARARVSASGTAVGEMRRTFEIGGAPRLAEGTTPAPGADAVRAVPVRLASRAAVTGPPFALAQVMDPPVLGTFLDRVAARPDASSPAVRQLLDQARTTGVRELHVPDAAGQDARAATFFLKGLSLLAGQKLDDAANAFRDSLRTAPDFYPAMVYLGACYAAGGKDREAAGAWRTALIRLDDAVSVHLLLADAWLRQGRGDQAFQVLDSARARWPDDPQVNRRFATAAIAAGRYVEGLEAVEEVVASGAQDEPLLALGLLVLYEAFTNGEPVVSVEQDRARMTRFADTYRSRGGPSLALVETWVSAAAVK